jgi:hypothetical protein|tara:strand:+ start:52 stop:204 length:153 start_codon:yes stop_codon:yes gene_type:complete
MCKYIWKSYKNGVLAGLRDMLIWRYRVVNKLIISKNNFECSINYVDKEED